jgi:hypothetical protein
MGKLEGDKEKKEIQKNREEEKIRNRRKRWNRGSMKKKEEMD